MVAANICARMGRAVSSAECCEIISTTQNSTDLATCRACPEGMALMGTAKSVAKEDIMAKGDCECCDVKGVTIYRKSGVDRCYHCHKSEAVPKMLPKAAETPDTSKATCQCDACQEDGPHMSDCAVHNAPALPVGPCDCGRVDEKAVEMAVAKQDHSGEPTEKVVGSEDHFADSSKMVAGEFSWDDFQAIMPMVTSRPSLVTIGKLCERICLNSTLQRTLGWKKGDKILIRISESHKAIAFKPCSEKHEEKAYSLTSGGKSSVLAVACKTALKVMGAAPGAYEITRTSWGFVAHLDRPVVETTGEAA